MEISDQILDWLMEKNNPSIRFLTLTTLLNRPLTDPEVREAKQKIGKIGLVPEILSQQNEDGSFGTPERFYRDKYKGTAWVLLLLGELWADSDDPRIKGTCEFILNYSQEPEMGGFSYDRSAKTGHGIPSGVVPCLTGNMVYTLIRLGYLEDSRVQKAIEWIIRFQRTDDGVSQEPRDPIYQRYKMCWGQHTCHMGVAKTLKALAAIPPEKRTREQSVKINELTDYFLIHHLYRKSHQLDQVARPGWLKLGFPLMYQTDILELTEIFAELGIKDPRLDDAIEIIANKPLKEGMWKLENSFNGKMLVTVEKKGQPSKWITLKALKVLKTYSLK
ncbi:nitrogen fixation protein NifH [Acetobacterium paludosum]|uniref:Nitrogen fixation protein NifH n=1 Tax=Acetobacterium paludosum TaxID=52693 RepID=A0A923HUB4_9FIRM|nr:prenyltransferase/squalene oxidase repeat-containing protein [Acetobacterium paludosum]MBC3887395.1 nitrogen fixation protein NifH [Acetobacterium paludosum]